MRRLQCPACGGASAGAAASVISPWVRELAGVRSKGGALHWCAGCGSAWFEIAYSDEEMAGLYAGYRDAEYQRIRQKWEPWYSESFNDFASDSPDVAQVRLKAATDFLTRWLEPAQVGLVADIGGDRGQYIPFGSDRVVVEVSDRELAEGVRRVPEPEDAPGADLVITAHVMEHLPDPSGELARYRATGARRLYVEVPHGVPTRSAARSLAGTVARSIPMTPAIWHRMTAPAAGRRRKFSTREVYRQSEHLNFYSQPGIEALARAAGWDVLGSDVGNTMGPDGGRTHVLQLLAANPDAS